MNDNSGPDHAGLQGRGRPACNRPPAGPEIPSKRRLLPAFALGVGVLSGLAPDRIDAACSHALRAPRDAMETRDRRIQYTRDWYWLVAISDAAGCRVEAASEQTQIQRRLELFARGELDVIAGASRRPDRETYAHFSKSYRSEKIRLFARLDKALPPIERLDDVLTRKLILIAPSSGWMGPEFERLRPALVKAKLLLEYRRISQGVSQLQAGRGDLLLGSDSLTDIVDIDETMPLRALPLVVHEEPTYLMLNRKTLNHSDLMAIDAAIDQLRRDGFAPND